MVADFAFLQKKLDEAYAFEHNFCSQGRLKGWRYVGTTTNWAMKSFWEQGKYHWVFCTLLRNLSLLNCSSLLEIILLFEIISYPGHFMPIHSQNKYIYQFEDGLQISRGKNDVLS